MFIFRLGRFKRSNSVTTAVQADLELEGFPSTEDKSLQFGGFQRHSEPSTPTQYNAVRTVRTQGLFSYREDYRPSSGPPSPQPESWLVEPAHEAAESGRVSPHRRDGSWFMQLLHSETKRLEGWCKDMEREAEEHDLSEESECARHQKTFVTILHFGKLVTYSYEFIQSNIHMIHIGQIHTKLPPCNIVMFSHDIGLFLSVLTKYCI